jgi:hypothetical protein
MPITKTEVLEVLEDWRLKKLRFSVGPVEINSFEYGQVADAIKAGAITVKAGQRNNYSQYRPAKNLLFTKVGNPPMDLNTRTNLLHECTHIISDINEVEITRLADEATAYLAQIAYLLLLDSSIAEPPRGPAINNMMAQGMKLVVKYKLGEPAGMGAKIAQSDIDGFARLIQAIPDYSNIGEKERLDADGVSLDEDQKAMFLQLQHDRLANQLMDERMADDVKKLLYPERIVAYENYVTWDPELLQLFKDFASGGSNRKEAVLKKLMHIFLSVDQRSAKALLQRLSTMKKGDAVSERFQSGFPPPQKSALLSALQIAR